MDFLVIDQIGDDGVVYEGLGCVNNPDYNDYRGPKVIYLLKAGGTNNSEIHNTCFTQIATGQVRFLIKEQEAKNKILASKKGQKMSAMQRLARLLPHIEATRTIEEMCNLRVKNSGNLTQVEQISKKINKDRFSSLEYALWRVKAIEDEYYKKQKRKKIDFKNFVLFSKGGK